MTRQLLRDVAEVIRDLQALNLLKDNVTSTVSVATHTHKYELTVKVVTSADTLLFVLDMFQTMRCEGYEMSVMTNTRDDPEHSVLVMKFVET